MQHLYYASVTLFIMPSQRKRIGYLPSEKIHTIIDKIGKKNNFSQSKVTGILVEEALLARGVLKDLVSENDYKNFILSDDYQLENSTSLNEYSVSNANLNSKNDKKIKEELKFINEFIEYKLFKKIIRQNYSDII